MIWNFDFILYFANGLREEQPMPTLRKCLLDTVPREDPREISVGLIQIKHRTCSSWSCV